jgi:glycine cleavage system aminomethyltransferase T
MGKEPVLADGKVLGYVTSAGYGYSLGRCVVFAYLPLTYAQPGTKVSVEYFGKALAATVVEKLL